MTKASFLNILCDQLGVRPGSLSASDTPATVRNWDSVGHMTIIAAIESNFSLDVSEHEELRRFKSIGELVKSLEKFGVLKD